MKEYAYKRLRRMPDIQELLKAWADGPGGVEFRVRAFLRALHDLRKQL